MVLTAYALAAVMTTTPLASPADGLVSLPLADYLGLIERVEAAVERDRLIERQASAPLFESERLALAVGKKSVTAGYELALRVESVPLALALPLPGLVTESAIVPSGAALGRGGDGRPTLFVERPGRYRFSARSLLPLVEAEGLQRFDLFTPLSPVARLEVDVAQEIDWELAGATLAAESVDAGRRRLELAPVRGLQVRVTLRRAGSEDDNELLAHTITLLALEARSDGVVRRDAVLYQVARGGLSELVLRTPVAIRPREVATDEGIVFPETDGERLVVRRERRLQGTGFALASSSVDPGAEVPLASFEPAVEVRARYLTFAARSATRFELTRPASWQRIDLADLPAALAERLAGSAVGSAYRFVGRAGDEGAARVSTLPPVRAAERLVARRETTTLLTAEGRVVHRDRLVLPPEATELELALAKGVEIWSARVANEAVRPLHSGGRWIVPLLAAGPGGAATVAEVVTLAPQAGGGRNELALSLPVVVGTVVDHRWRIVLPDGRRYRLRASELQPAGISRVAHVSAPTYELPEGSNIGSGTGNVYGNVQDDKGQPLPGAMMTLNAMGRPLAVITDAQGEFAFRNVASGSYRLAGNLDSFSPVVYEQVIVHGGTNTVLALTMNAAVAETITVTAESPLLDTRKVSTGATYDLGGSGSGFNFSRRRERSSQPPATPELPSAELQRELAELKAGLVGGVRPIAVALPESGKLIALAGVLPPSQVTAVFDFKRERRRRE